MHTKIAVDAILRLLEVEKERDDAVREIERLQGDLAVAGIDIADAEMRERHLRADYDRLLAEYDEQEARLAEAKQLLKDATPRMMRRHPSSQSSYKSAWDRWLDRRNAFLNWRNDLGE